MQTISVFLQDNLAYIETFRSTIFALRQKVHTDPVTIEFREFTQGKQHVFRFISWSNEEYTLQTRDIVRSFVAIVVADWIVRTLEPWLMKHYVERKTPDKPAHQWEEVRPFIHMELPECERREHRRTQIYKKAFAHLQDENVIDVDGFVRFRLKEYVQFLQEAADAGIDDFMEELQYKEFVQLLRYFIAMQEPRYDIVHLLQGEKKEILFFDVDEQPISISQLDYMLSAVEQNCREEDYVISALITLSPKKIILHSLDPSKSLLQTLETIYEERLVYCTACTHCLLKQGLLEISSLDLNQPTHI